MLMSKLFAMLAVIGMLADGGAKAPTKPEAAKAANAKSETANSETAKTEPAKAESGKPAAAKAAPAKTTPAKPALFEIEQKVVDETNAQRARYGLPPLVVDQRLVQSARTHTTWMTRSRSLQHTSRPVAENIAMGQRSAPEVLNSWMNSSGHRANILNRGHRRIGVSAYRTPEGTVYWCQQFQP